MIGNIFKQQQGYTNDLRNAIISITDVSDSCPSLQQTLAVKSLVFSYSGNHKSSTNVSYANRTEETEPDNSKIFRCRRTR